MRSLTLRPLAAVVATAALVLLSAGPASAVDPGDGAVIFNPDGTPIGSELTYDGGTPQFVYTSETDDDDYWGLDSDGFPANEEDYFGTLSAGIPLGFTVTVSGISYDEAYVNSNGGVCLTSSSDPASQGSLNECDDFYYELVGSVFDLDYSGDTDNYAAFFPLNNDQYPSYGSTPVDGPDPDSTVDSCTFGAFLFEYEAVFYCSSVFWGTTTYEGKPAFAATWYHNPDYYADTDTDFNTFQVLLVNDGGGNVTVVYNYDEVNEEGGNLDFDPTSTFANEAACAAAYDEGNGDTAEYLSIGMGGVNFTTSEASYLNLFGPACDDGINPQTADALGTDGSYELASHSLNSTVPGRYVFRVVDGLGTLTMPAAPPAPAPRLAETGSATSGIWMAAAGTLLLGGIVVVAASRRRWARLT